MSKLIGTDERGCLLQPERVSGPWPQSDSASSGVLSIFAEADMFDAFGLELAKYQIQSDFLISNEPVPCCALIQWQSYALQVRMGRDPMATVQRELASSIDKAHLIIHDAHQGSSRLVFSTVYWGPLFLSLAQVFRFKDRCWQIADVESESEALTLGPDTLT